MEVEFCSHCDSTGIKYNGDYCDCELGIKLKQQALTKIKTEKEQADLRSSIIPKEYCDKFSIDFVKDEYQDSVGVFLEEVHKYIEVNKTIPRNILICSPPGTSKTVFQYSILKYCIENNVSYCKPMFISEINNMSNNREMSTTLSKIYTTPILFVKIDSMITLGFVEVMQNLIDHRSNLGLSTMFFSSISYEDLLKKPTGKLLCTLINDGLYKSLQLKDFFNITKEK